jgi:hypothetical protein
MHRLLSWRTTDPEQADFDARQVASNDSMGASDVMPVGVLFLPNLSSYNFISYAAESELLLYYYLLIYLSLDLLNHSVYVGVHRRRRRDQHWRPEPRGKTGGHPRIEAYGPVDELKTPKAQPGRWRSRARAHGSASPAAPLTACPERHVRLRRRHLSTVPHAETAARACTRLWQVARARTRRWLVERRSHRSKQRRAGLRAAEVRYSWPGRRRRRQRAQLHVCAATSAGAPNGRYDRLLRGRGWGTGVPTTASVCGSSNPSKQQPGSRPLLFSFHQNCPFFSITLHSALS